MDYRQVGSSGLAVSELSFGAATFGGYGDFFGAWGDTGVDEARAMVDLCVESGITLFDTADVYSAGRSEEVLGRALEGRRDEVLISTKAALPTGDGPADAGTSRGRLIGAVEHALRRLKTDRIDLFQLHAFDAFTPVEEVLDTLETLVDHGKIRYTGVSNFAGWQLMKSLAAADAAHQPRHVAHQVYYSLIGRDYEWELMPLGLDQGVGALVWSPLGWGRLTGRIRRDSPLPPVSRLHKTADAGPPVEALQAMFAMLGYGVSVDGVYDERFEAVVAAFQRHWRPEKIDGVADGSTITTLRDLLALTQEARTA